MGPPLFRGGHVENTWRASSRPLLQWGHLSLEVVMAKRFAEAMRLELLQWGHLSLEVVITWEQTAICAEDLLQWGHLSLEVVIPRGAGAMDR